MAVTRGQSQRDDGPASGAKSEAPADASAQPNGRGMQEQHEQPGGPQPPPAGPKEEEPATWKVLVVVVCTLTSILAGIMGVIWLTKASDETACQSSPPYGETRGRGWFRGCKWEAASDPGYDPRSTWFSRKACGAASRVDSAIENPTLSTRAFMWVLRPSRGWLQKACQAVTPKDGSYPLWRPDVEQWQQESLTFFLSTSFVLAAFFIPVTRYLFDKFCLRLGQRVLAPVMGFVPEPTDITVVKWREACWKLLTYAGLSLYGLFVILGEEWVLDTSKLWQGWPRQHHSTPLLLWYCLEFGMYGYGLVDIIVWEAVRSDYFSMIIHHISTLSLLFGSFYFGFLRIGALIMIMNDFVDVWFEGAKIANYAKKQGTSTFFYVSFVMTWFFLRQVYCPWVLQWACSFQAWELVDRFGPSTFNVGTWIAFNSLLMVLEIQHTYWFVFIIQKVQVKFSIRVMGRYDTDLTED